MNQLLQLLKPKTAAWLLGVAVVISVFVLFLLGSSSKPAKTLGSTAKRSPDTAIIEITKNGFIPSAVSVRPDTKVTWLNEDAVPHLPAADPYPSHSDLPALVAPRALGNRETYTFLFTKRIVISYHDDLNPMMTGVIEVR